MSTALRQTLLFLLGLLLLLGSCNPVKRVLKDPQKFEQVFAAVKDSVVARGYCVNDTITTEVIKNSVQYRDTTLLDTVLIAGVATPVACTGQVAVRTITKLQTNTVRDTRMEDLLLRQRVLVEDSLGSVRLRAARQHTQLVVTEEKLGEVRGHLYMSLFFLVVLGVLMLIRGVKTLLSLSL